VAVEEIHTARITLALQVPVVPRVAVGCLFLVSVVGLQRVLCRVWADKVRELAEVGLLKTCLVVLVRVVALVAQAAVLHNCLELRHRAVQVAHLLQDSGSQHLQHLKKVKKYEQNLCSCLFGKNQQPQTLCQLLKVVSKCERMSRRLIKILFCLKSVIKNSYRSTWR
jgi:hypothetical protein